MQISSFSRSLIFFLACAFVLLLLGRYWPRTDQPHGGLDPASEKYSGDMVLALSWQPGFCETRPRLGECRSQTPQRFDATHFTLHGLWPQPGSNVYCGVADKIKSLDKSGHWQQLQRTNLPIPLQRDLERVMPGSQSGLDRHEWVKHGTCYSESAEDYYVDSLVLMEKINGSQVQQLFARSVGKTLRNEEIRAAFDTAFGKGVGKRVRLSCKRVGSRSVITELTLGLSGRIESNPDIGMLALASSTTKPGCPAGVVDAVGLQ